MADDPQDDVESESDEPAVATQEAPEIDHARALGASARGQSVPQGEDLTTVADNAIGSGRSTLPNASGRNPVQEDTSSPLMTPEPLNQADIIAKAHRQLESDTLEQWNSDHNSGKPVPGQSETRPFGYDLKPKHYRAAEIQAMKQARAERAQAAYGEREQKQAIASTRESEMRDTGQRFYTDEFGRKQPILDPDTKRPLYSQSDWRDSVHPKTKQPMLEKRDQFGQRQFKDYKIAANPDLNDPYAYRVKADGTMEKAGLLDDLAKDGSDINRQRGAIRAIGARTRAMWQEALRPMQDHVSQAGAALEDAQLQASQLKTRSDDATQKIARMEDQLKAFESDSAAGKSIQTKIDALKQDQLTTTAEMTRLNALTSGAQNSKGALFRAHQDAMRELQLFQNKFGHAKYSSMEDERRAILTAQGASQDEVDQDPTLNSILQAKQAHEDAMHQILAPEKTPGLTDAQRIASSGAPLPLGQAVPGKPGLFQSVRTMPQGNDPVMDPDNPTAPVPSTYTLSSRGTTKIPSKMTTAEIAGRFQEIADRAQPFVDFVDTARAAIAAGPIESGLVKRYGNDQTGASASMVARLVNRSKEIDDLISDKASQTEATSPDSAAPGRPPSNLDPKVKANLATEKAWVDDQIARRMPKLSKDAQGRVKEITRDPTALDAIKGAVKSSAEGMYTGVGAAVKGISVGTHWLTKGQDSSEQNLNDIKSDPIYRAGQFIQEAARDTYKKSGHQQEGLISEFLNGAAEGAGGFAPVVASAEFAPLTIGLQTAGEHVEALYQQQIEQGKKPEEAAKYAINHSVMSGVVSAALWEVLPKALHEPGNKQIVNRIVAAGFKKWVGERIAQAGEGAILGGASKLTENATTGQPLTEGVGEAAAGMAGINVISPRAPSHPTDISPQTKARNELNARLAKKIEPGVRPPESDAPPLPRLFTPTGEGKPQTAKEAAQVLLKKTESDQGRVPGPDEVPPAKGAEESARVFKAQEELNRRAADQEKRAQKLVDQIQQATGKPRDEILATRKDKNPEDWIDELKKEAAYQKNPLVVDPERRANELREEIKKLDADWAERVKAASQPKTPAAETPANEPGKAGKLTALEKHQAIQRGMESDHQVMLERKQAIAAELDAAERLRQSPQGAAKLKQDLALEQKRAAQPKEDPVADYNRHQEIQAEMRKLTQAGVGPEDPRFQKLWQENEEIKNRNSSDPGNPPEKPSRPPLYRGTTREQWAAVQRGEQPQSEFTTGGLTWATTDKQSATAYSRRDGKDNAVVIEYKDSAHDKVSKLTDDPGDKRRQGNLRLADIQRVTDADGNVIYEAPAEGKTSTATKPNTNETKTETQAPVPATAGAGGEPGARGGGEPGVRAPGGQAGEKAGEAPVRPQTAAEVKSVASESDMAEMTRKYGPPNQVDLGFGKGDRAKATLEWVDDATGKVVGRSTPEMRNVASPLGDQRVKLTPEQLGYKMPGKEAVELDARHAEKTIQGHISALAKVMDCIGMAA